MKCKIQHPIQIFKEVTMKVLLINGSPHKEGCTYTALKEVADTLEANGIKTEMMYLGVKPIAGCIACGNCQKTGKCFVDDRVNEFIAKLPEIDGIVLGSPVYYAGASGQITSFLDRAFLQEVVSLRENLVLLLLAVDVVEHQQPLIS